MTDIAHEEFARFIESVPDAMVVVDEAGRIVLVNGQAESIFGYRRTELLGAAVEVLLPDNLRDKHLGHRASYSQDPRVRPMGVGIELFARRKDATEFPVEISLSPIESDGQQLVTAAIRDISDRRKAEQKFRGLLESAPDAMVIVDRNGAISLVNSQTEKLFGYERGDLLGKSVEILLPDRFKDRHHEHRSGYFSDPHTRPMGVGLELYARRWDGSEFPVEISLSPMESEAGLLVTATIRDITERKEADTQLRESLEEKEVLLKEIHHRVKNNLQVVASLLALQSSALQDPLAREAFEESRNRVKSMALVHETLYQSGTLSAIDFAAYLDRLGKDVFQSYGHQGGRITLEVDVDPVPLDVEMAVHMGLLVNELVSNALKHAFAGRKEGVVQVRFTRGPVHGGTGLILTVSDNGIGLPETPAEGGAPTLGIHLVEALAQQLSGSVEVIRDPGTTFTIRIPDRGSTG